MKENTKGQYKKQPAQLTATTGAVELIRPVSIVEDLTMFQIFPIQWLTIIIKGFPRAYNTKRGIGYCEEDII